MAKTSINWQLVASDESIRRSSQVIGVNGSTVSVFGGEVKPREPVDSHVYNIDLEKSGLMTTSKSTKQSPPPRVGSAATTFNGKTYLFSGRGGVEMAPLDEQGLLWCLDHTTGSWSRIEPSNSSAPVPQPRSYHALVSDDRDALYLQAGCPEKGRLNDLWAFQLSTRRWIQLSSAPGPERGGTSIAYCGKEDLLFRMNGFDGKTELGGTLDIYSPHNDTWHTKEFAADGEEGPEARSVGSLLCLKQDGKSYLITLFGERDPSSLGHEGAGKMLGDGWAWDIQEESWSKIEFRGDKTPVPRGWFAAQALQQDQVVVYGGLAEDNSRLGDMWLGKLAASA